MAQSKSLEGQKFNRWTVLTRHGSRNGRAQWLVVCECGTFAVQPTSMLTTGGATSCGCRMLEVSKTSTIRHGRSNTHTYVIWMNMKQRTTNPNTKAWPNYGGRGIGLSKEWEQFENFFRDMGEAPEGLQLDRRDNNLGYSKENCRWVTRKVNCENKRTNVMLEYAGNQVTLAEASRLSGIDVRALKKRHQNGLTEKHLFWEDKQINKQQE